MHIMLDGGDSRDGDSVHLCAADQVGYASLVVFGVTRNEDAAGNPGAQL